MGGAVGRCAVFRAVPRSANLPSFTQNLDLKDLPQ